MTLSQTQLQTLKAAISAETDVTFVSHRTAGATGAMADWYNLPSSISVWKTNTKVTDILDSITWQNFTPTDAPDTTSTFTNRLLVVQTKQMNLQNMLIGRDIIDTSKVNVRSGLRDAVIALPTGAAGVNTSAGGASAVTVLTSCTRIATQPEKLYTSTVSTTGTVSANLLVVEGKISNENIVEALNS